jgi:SAM-dependent methyltransferase
MTHMGYQPDEYWENRGGDAYRAYTESTGYRRYRDAQEGFFRTLIGELRPRRLLDFGCGTGKLFGLWTDVPEVHAYDRARSQIDIARREAVRIRPDNPYRVMHCLGTGRSETPYDDDDFDLVVAAEVLLHVLPNDIEPLMAELHRICRGHLAIVTAAPFDNAAPHCFNHDYTRLLQTGFEIAEDQEQHAQRYLLARKSTRPFGLEPGQAVSSSLRSPAKSPSPKA